MDSSDIWITAFILIVLLVIGGAFYYSNESSKKTNLLMDKLCDAYDGYLEGYKIIYYKEFMGNSFDYYEVYCRVGRELITVKMK